MLTLRDAAVRKLDVVLNAPAPGGEEQKALTAVPVTDATIRSHFSSLTVSNTKSEYDQIRDKIIKSSKKFLSNRLNIEQEKCVQLMINVLSATTCATLIHHSVNALKLFISSNDDEKINSLVSDICEQWQWK